MTHPHARTPALALAALLALAPPPAHALEDDAIKEAIARGAIVENAYGHFVLGEWQATYDILQPYRAKNGGTLRVDFMLAVSSCRMKDGKVWGLEALRKLSGMYSPMYPAESRDIQTQIARCSGQTSQGGALPDAIAPAGGHYVAQHPPARQTPSEEIIS